MEVAFIKLTNDGLELGNYTLIFEIFAGAPNQNSPASTKIITDRSIIYNTIGDGYYRVLHHENHRVSNQYTRSYKAIIYPGFYDLDIDIALKNKSGQASDSTGHEEDTEIFVVVYGVSGKQNDVDLLLWDRFYYIEKGKVVSLAPIDMNNRQIKKLSDGNKDSDAINLKQLNDSKKSFETSVSNSQSSIATIHTDLSSNVNKNSNSIKAIYRNLIRNDSKLLLIKELYFPDSNEGRTQNNNVYSRSGDNKGDVTFYLTFVHKSTTNDALIINPRWRYSSKVGRINIFITKDRVIVSRNALISEPSLKTINIPDNAKGKQIYFWITIKDSTIKIILSGLSGETTVSYRSLLNLNIKILGIYVSDSPFTIKRGLMTKNLYDTNSDAFKDVREFEKSEGTII